MDGKELYAVAWIVDISVSHKPVRNTKNVLNKCFDRCKTKLFKGG